jgi:phosphatidylserine decarboxylase
MESNWWQRLRFLSLVLLPKKLFSRHCGWVADQRWPSYLLHQVLIRYFIRYFNVDLSECPQKLEDFQTFNEFFTRPLKPEARPIATYRNALVCPVDGTIGTFGTINQETLLQAKGKEYLVTDLLQDSFVAREFESGIYLTIYLAPYNYHRIHSIVAGSISRFTYIPGELWTVSPLGLAFVPRLFARNERWISYIDTEYGVCALVKVGATVVGRIRTVYHANYSNRPGATPIKECLSTPYPVEAGEEIGRFELGSTVVLLFPKNQVELNSLELGQTVRLGEVLGHFQPPESP